MGKRIKLLKMLMKINKEIDANPELEKKMLPYVNNAKKKDCTIADIELFIKEYKRIKNE